MEKKHGVYWVLKNGVDIEKIKFLYGKPKRKGRYELELPTIECMNEFDGNNPDDSCFESTRWFVAK